MSTTPDPRRGGGMPSRPVFRDDSARRWPRLVRLVLGTTVLLAISCAAFWWALERSVAGARAVAPSPSQPFDDVVNRVVQVSQNGVPAPVNVSASFIVRRGASPAEQDAPTPEFPLRMAWLDGLGAEGVRSVEGHWPRLTDVALTGLALGDDARVLTGGVPREAVSWGHQMGLKVWEVLDDRQLPPSLVAETRLSDGGPVESLAADLDWRLTEDGADGALLDLEEDEGDADGAARQLVVREMVARLHESDHRLGIAIDGDFDPESLRDLAELADLVLLRARAGEPDLVLHPVAPRRWFQATVRAAAAVVAPEKLVVGLPTRPACWSVSLRDLSVREAIETSWTELMAMARVAGARPDWQGWAANPLLILPGPRGIASTTLAKADFDDPSTTALVSWLADGATFADQVTWLHKAGLDSIAVDDVGGEDPRIWAALEPRPTREALARALSVIHRDTSVRVVGRGIHLTPVDGAKDGTAHVFFAPDGSVAGERHDELPQSPLVVRRAPVPPKTVALTFDDGPSAEYTPQILAVLREQRVPATFFLVGARIERQPEILQDIVAEGHEIGNHSFSHPDLGFVTPRRASLEIGATNLLLGAVTGRTTRLFRPPFRADDAPSDEEDGRALQFGERMSMASIASTVDPRDWERPGEEAIARAVVDQVERDGGGVVLLHDGGGDRSQTVGALAVIIDSLRSRGFRFVRVHDVLGTTDAAVNPPVPYQLDLQVNRAGWWAGAWALRGLQAIALLALAVASIRYVALAAGALLAESRQRSWPRTFRRALAPMDRVSVVIPAYNEAKVIAHTIDSVLASSGVPVEVIVVNDGSTDDTSDVVRRIFDDERVRLFDQPNRGKAEALNFGFRQAANDIVVALDADTVFLPDTVAELVRGFDSSEVAAVAGRAVVGNTRGFIGRCQAVEYMFGQAIERRAWHALDLVSVVPGAVGAWRRQAVLAAGGFRTDTLAEDCDLTIELQSRGWRVSYAPAAVALTEAPETLRALFKQRFRWSFGVLQTVWKHRGSLVRPNPARREVGFLLLPAILSCHLSVPFFAPLADLAAAIAIYLGYGSSVLVFVVCSVAAELLLLCAAIHLARPRWALLWDWPLQRLLYRWILFVPLFRAVMAALRGRAVGWGKLIRTGTVRAPHEELPT